MHELGLCEAIVDAALQGAAGRRVVGVRVRVGAQHRVSQGDLDHAFALIAEGTMVEGAAVDMVLVPARILCGSCHFDGETHDVVGLCPRCGSPDVSIIGGDEITVESLQLAKSNNA
ncbi:MAG: hydrogenase maturation nickel metallochaperone HypA [Actinomycetota bacterium]